MLHESCQTFPPPQVEPIVKQESYAIPAGPKLNLGCGPIQPEDWVNIDGSNRAWFASRASLIDRMLVKLKLIPPTEFGPHIKICDLFKPLPYADNSVACIYAGEVWEHFEYVDAKNLTAECFRVLAPGGVLRVCVPDGVTFWEGYLKRYREIEALPKEARDAAPLRELVEMYFEAICTRRRILGSMGFAHKWQFDEIQLVELLETEGFTEVERMEFHDSRIPGIEGAERSDFLIVEAIKPAR